MDKSGPSVTTEKDDDQQLAKRLALRTANVAHLTASRDSSLYDKLDGSIKKNTSLIKKLKSGITSTQFAAIKKDVLSLKLEKYIEEVALSISEAIYKTSSDIWAAVEISSLIHQRYAAFSPLLLANTLKHFGPPPSFVGVATEQRERDETVRVHRQRSSLRFISELYLVGIAQDPPKSKDGLIGNILFEMLSKDKTHLNISICVAFVKFFSICIIDSKHLQSEETADQDNHDQSTTMILDSLIPSHYRTSISKILNSYFDSAAFHLIRDHQHVKRLEKITSDCFIARGEIYEDKQDAYDKTVKVYQKLRTSVETLSTYLKRDMPELAEDDDAARSGMNIIMSGGKSIRDEKEFKTGIWEDEESKLFYDNILDLKNQVPAILLGIRPKDDKPSEDTVSKSDDNAPTGDQDNPISVETTIHDGTDEYASVLSTYEPTTHEHEEKKVESASFNATLITIFSRMLNAVNKETIDQIAVEFAFQNNRGSRRKMVETLLALSYQRLDLIPYYSRLIATLNPYMPDIGTGVLEELNRMFHAQQKRKEQMFIDKKIKVIRYIGELTKFRITPLHVVFHVIKVLLDDFMHHNVDLLCALLDNCGRFLFRHPDTNAQTADFIEIMQRKKISQNLDSRHIFMIDNAIHECNPPDTVAFTIKQREPMVQYLRKLIYYDLDLSSARSILVQLRKANWSDPLVLATMRKLFTKIWKIKFSNLGLMAFLSSELSRYYPEFGVAIVDSCLEDIRCSLEENIFKHNQRRISTAKFLGHLHTYRMVDSNVIFETLYLLLRFGHVGGVPMPHVSCPLDAANDFFRLRLVCTILDACGSAFQTGIDGRSLDDFLAFMQMYMFTKTALPMEAEFFIDETLEMVRPKLIRVKSYDEAVELVNKIAERQSKVQRAMVPTAGVHGDSSTTTTAFEGVQDDADDEVLDLQGSDAEEEADLEDLSDDENGEHNESLNDDDEEELVIRMAPPPKTEEDLDFEREFSSMMQESLDSRKNERKPSLFDAPIPRRLKSTAAPTGNLNISPAKSDEMDEADDEGFVKFTMLTRRGNKQQAKTMELPADSLFAVSTLFKQQAEQEEKTRLKKLVLGYEERERSNFLREQAFQNGSWQASAALFNGPSNDTVDAPSNSSRGRGRGKGRGSYRVIWTSAP
ncbi:hypothetical protein BDV3_003204 [Batrachochytrium dendrobatidis]